MFMKKILSVILIGVLVIILSGCGNKELEEPENPPKDEIEGYTYVTTLNCEALEKEIKYMKNGIIITNDNEVYAYNADKKYSNGTDCAKFEQPVEIKIIDGDKFYENDKQLLFKLEDLSMTTNSGDLTVRQINALKEVGYSISMQGPTQDGYANTHYGIKGNSNIIYKFQIGIGTKKVNGFNKTYNKVEKEQIDYSVPEDEVIISFYYNKTEKDFIYDFIRTNKSYYGKRITNIEECNEFVDVKCNYEWYKNDVLSKIADILISTYGGEIITKDGKIYHENNK